MPSYKRYSKRRYYKRRYNKYKFSKYNTYKNRSSKSQANQIYQLNKKINRIEYRTKPEFKTLSVKAHPLIETPTTGYATHEFWHIFHADTVEFNDMIDGSFARLINIKFWGNFYRPDTANSSLHSWARIVVFQYPRVRGDRVSVPDMITGYTDQTVLDSDINLPFADHITQTVKILADKKMLLSNSNVKNKPFKFNVKPKYNYAKNQNENVAAGDISVLIIMKQSSSTTVSQAAMDINFKMCYTDS